jgi:hypothetical protein
MAELTTTVRVRTSTRDELKALSTERHQSVDELVQRGIALVRKEEWRRQAEIDARRAAADPADRHEVASLLRDLTGE